MTIEERNEILVKAKAFFLNRIAVNHVKNTIKLNKLNEFNVNPFLHKYLSQFAFGNSEPDSMAKALLYPRVLGTSITTSFGANLQYFCNDVLKSYASTTSGIDIEFVDCLDGRKKYCQTKAGPNTINADDVVTIRNHFTAIKNLARTNRLANFNPMYDCIVGVFYGTPEQLTAHYNKIGEEYPVYVGQEFWERLTGDANFYTELANAFAEVADEIDASELMTDLIQTLGKKIEEIY